MARTYLKQATTGAAAATSPSPDVPAIVKGVIDTIRRDGDAAVRLYSEKFDRWSPASFRLSSAEIADAMAQVPAQTLQDIKDVQANVRQFAEAQRRSITDFELETAPGVFLGQRNNPIETVGAYVPRFPCFFVTSPRWLTLTATSPVDAIRFWRRPT